MSESNANPDNHRRAWGYGVVTVAADETVLDAWFPDPKLGDPTPDAQLPEEAQRLLGSDDRREVTLQSRLVVIELDAPPSDTADAYLRLHLLSTLQVAPNSVNLDGIFGCLPGVVFTGAGPVHADALDRLRPRLRREGIHPTGLDKFPALLDYVTPRGVRIADASRVRLGAHLAPGTTVMHEGFVNFNAGTLGTSMVEGRISQGVTVGDGSDIGGGASIMGTLSGGGTQRITIGRRCLLGANSGLGISLGDDCVVEAGLYLTAGTKVTLTGGLSSSRGTEPTTQIKAAQLSGASGILFRRNSVTGAVEAHAQAGVGVTLNAALHS